MKIKLFKHITSYFGSSWFITASYLPSKSVINVQNKDNKCFKWAILSALHPVDKGPRSPSKYKDFGNELNFTNITFPVKASDYKTIQENNLSFGIKIYEHEFKYYEENYINKYIIIY